VRRAAQNGYRNLDATVIAVDLSRTAVKNGDLPEAKAAAAAIVQASGSRQIALIAYAGDAYLATPFTNDQDWLQTEISALDGQTIPDEGTHPVRALSLARRILQRDHIVQANVILVSAGAGIDASAFQEARHLAASGYSVATVFTPPGKTINSGEASLKRLAADGKGASANARSLEPVLRLAERAPPHLSRSEYALLIWRDLGPFFMLAALIPALFLFRRTR
jgi:Ca-activated chloride channel family protein